MLTFMHYELWKTADAWNSSFDSFVLWVSPEIQLVFE